VICVPVASARALATSTGGEVTGPHGLTQALADRGQCGVAGFVAVAVVDGFEPEPVEVERDCRERLA
jgi:hypothetical protein